METKPDESAESSAGEAIPKLHYAEVAFLADNFPEHSAGLSAALRLFARIRELERAGVKTWHFAGDYPPLSADEVAAVVTLARDSEGEPWAT